MDYKKELEKKNVLLKEMDRQWEIVEKIIDWLHENHSDNEYIMGLVEEVDN
jgi:glycyl-tRNA synthetase beta subunit